MSKKCQKENYKKRTNSASNVNKKQLDGKSSVLSAVIGVTNVKRWKHIKTVLSYKTDEKFVKLLLDLAEKYVVRNKLKNESKETKPGNSSKSDDEKIKDKYEKTSTNSRKKDHKHKRKKSASKTKDSNENKAINVSIKDEKEEKNTNECEIKSNNVKPDEKPRASLMVNISNELLVPLELNNKLNKNIQKNVESNNGTTKKVKPADLLVDKKTKKHEHDIRKAPELILQNDTKKEESQKFNDVELEEEQNVIKTKLCNSCGSRHMQDKCPLVHTAHEVFDSLTMDEWKEKLFDEYLNECNKIEQTTKEDSVAQVNKYTFAYSSLPQGLYIDESNTPHGLSVFVSSTLQEYTQFGPLIGSLIKEVDIPEECNMRDMFELNVNDTHLYFNTENLEESNWMRFVRPAPSREARNLMVTYRNNLIYFVAVKTLSSGDELLYWQDDTNSNVKKKMEKTTCGGCNMTFLHPIYYRTHCSVFHDIRYSLTIRKYHCKVCGAAVLGKENIMKHATELHNGQGAYQCQYCKKYFLRLNYLEMHRTYGCSANPHRSRPLCDFCGRKFCQPQKLKVHIKRMHSDMSEVLKEFQCKNCLKILGSRAALQRHMKEVHQKQVDGACACSRCGKLFQNKSNLKIHMLTHSGIKPFKCSQKECNAAFTTKQCLQFHYKKVHGFAEDVMPKIERSVDYTFEAYSGADDHEMKDLSRDKDTDKSGSNNESDQEDNNLEEQSIDEPPALHSPIPLRLNEQSNSNSSPPTLEAYAPNMKILSKGSKKWIGEQSDLYSSLNQRKNENSNEVIVEEQEESPTPTYDSTKLQSNLSFNRHESSNASLLVEAALDSVCSEPNIDIDVSTTPSCTDALVNNLYTLSHNDTLADVTYNHSVDVNDSRDINLISPSVNDQISVTDDINDELRQTQTIGIDYSSFHQDDFSPPNSPNRNNFVRDYINENSPPTHVYEAQSKSVSPPRYDFGAGVVNPESDDSNGMGGAQNLSLHNGKDAIQLDLSIYKSHYNFDNVSAGFMRSKDLRMINKFDEQQERKAYLMDVVDKGYGDDNKFNGSVDATQDNLENELTDKDFESMEESKHKENDLDLSMRSNLTDIRSKFELDLDMRKSYDIDAEMRRNTYEGSLDDFRIKNYDLESLELRNNLERNKTYESLIDDFRPDRNFEPLVLNTSELQGLDMSARSYHNYSNLNRYHHLYTEVDRPTVDLRLNYSPPPPSYSHADILRVSLDLAPPGRHSVDLSLRTHQIANSRLLSEHTLQTTPHRLTLDQRSLLSSELSASRHLTTDSRLISDMSNRILSDHTTNRLLANEQLTSNRLLGNDQRIISEDSRIIGEQSRLLGDGRILPPAPPGNGSISPVPYSGYSVSPSPYHPTALPPRPHGSSPNSAPYHHYSAYY